MAEQSERKNTKHLADTLIKELGDSGIEHVSKAAAYKALRGVFESMAKDILKGGSISVFAFGTFKPKYGKAKTARNPRTGDPVKVDASVTIGFRAASGVKKKMTKKAGKKK